MKQQSGFTLIELVIVIIILGILSATAIPKFMDLQGDAREASLDGVKSALEGAATITYSKAAIDGNENSKSGDTVEEAAIVYGYPAATSAALNTVAELGSDWTVTDGTNEAYITPADQDAGTDGGVCQVTYKEATTSASRPTISVVTGC